jgi:hypothetical protein
MRRWRRSDVIRKPTPGNNVTFKKNLTNKENKKNENFNRTKDENFRKCLTLKIFKNLNFPKD